MKPYSTSVPNARAVRLTAASQQYYQRTASAINYNAPYTAGWWVYMYPSIQQWHGMVMFKESGTAAADICELQLAGASYPITYLGVHDGTTATDVDGSRLRPNLVGGWNYFTVVRSSTTDCRLYVNAELDATNTRNVSSRSACTKMILGAWTPQGEETTDFADGKFGQFRIWERALSVSEIREEMRSATVRNRYKLWAELDPSVDGPRSLLMDVSGNSRHFTAPAGYTLSDGPPVHGLRARIYSFGDFGPSTFLSERVDEETADDGDYIYATAASASAKLSLGTLTDPASSSGHILRYKVPTLTGGASVTAKLYQGTTLIATDTTRTTTGTYEMTLSSGQADSITDYSALAVQFDSGSA